jgi:ribonucleoside-diphosphate reductase alpha chain
MFKNVSSKLLQDIIVFTKYAQYLKPLKRRETWSEIVLRNRNMHIKKFPLLANEIEKHFAQIEEQKVLPSMRSLQFAGLAIEKQNTRMYNCCALPIDDVKAFSEIMYLLLGGSGVGYSVQKHHVAKLPRIIKNEERKEFVVEDSREGWSDAIDCLMQSYFVNSVKSPIFDYSLIRPEGSLISTGGIAPGPKLLKKCLDKIKNIMDNAKDYLKPIEVHDIVCHIADAVAGGGVRRAALISLFSVDDNEMMKSKSGTWYIDNAQRARANNSVMLKRDLVSREEFDKLWECVKASGSGEPGFYFTNDLEWLVNPCAEIALRPFQFCNLCEINASDLSSQEDLNSRAVTAAFIGTLQASYTDFKYLRKIWRETTEADALIGIGMTGICAGSVLKFDLKEAAQKVLEENARVAQLIGINKAARSTTVKPSGTTSLVLGTSSGIHPWFGKYYIRRISLEKTSALYKFLEINNPEILEDDAYTTSNGVVCFPLMAPNDAVLRNEGAMSLLERVKKFNLEWVKTGHRDGINTNNVSATISIKDEEWETVGEWMWNNKTHYNGLSVLPFNDTVYPQMPFTECSREEYETLVSKMKQISIDKIVEDYDTTTRKLDEACAGGACEF